MELLQSCTNPSTCNLYTNYCQYHLKAALKNLRPGIWKLLYHPEILHEEMEFQWLGPNVSQIWIEYIKPIGQYDKTSYQILKLGPGDYQSLYQTIHLYSLHAHWTNPVEDTAILKFNLQHSGSMSQARSKSNVIYGSGRKGRPVLLPGFAIISLVQNQIW